jgi:hypothetical protein
MFSYEFYKWLHLSSLFIMVLTTGVLLSSAVGADLKDAVRKNIAKIHGSSLLVVFIAGFGLLARVKTPSPFSKVWFLAKLAVWLLFGLLPIFIRKTPEQHKPKLILVYALLPALVVYLVINQPF